MKQGIYSTADQRQLIILQDLNLASIRNLITNHVEWYDWEFADDILSLLPRTVKTTQQYRVQYVEGDFTEETTTLRHQYDHHHSITRIDQDQDEDTILPELLYGTPISVNYTGTLNRYD